MGAKKLTRGNFGTLTKATRSTLPTKAIELEKGNNTSRSGRGRDVATTVPIKALLSTGGHMHGGWKGLLFRSRHFFLTVSVVVPVGITLIDEVGLPGNVKGVSMRVSYMWHDG